jgi:hypothetical protein
LVHLPVEIEIELFDLAIRSGLKVLEAMLEEDRTAICGPRYVHQPDRVASRAGSTDRRSLCAGRASGQRRVRCRCPRNAVTNNQLWLAAGVLERCVGIVDPATIPSA